MKSEEYVLDITIGPPYPFCPYENGNVVLGLMIIQDKCPGKLIGLYTENDEQAMAFEKEIPDWRTRFGQTSP